MQPTVSTSQTAIPPFWPAVTDNADALGVERRLLLDLMLRHVRLSGAASLRSLSRTMRLSVPVVESLFHQLRQQQLIDVEGMTGDDYSFRLTARGRDMAVQPGPLGQYAGPAPVSIEEYYKLTKQQAARIALTRAKLKRSFADLVLPDDLLDQIGPAFISHKSIFIYGPTGNGKTSVAERLVRLYDDSIVMPYAVLAAGHVITVFDPVVHEALPISDENYDQRWVPCRRPCVMVGGELSASMLELRVEESTGVCAAPLQMKANNGIFIIDDFGRQLLSPRDLLNRWIVPLDRRVDYLTLSHGVKFQIPFELLVIFSTNLDPYDLADEAFLRRIHTKVYVGPVSESDFDEIYRRTAEGRNLPFDPDAAAFLRSICVQYGPLRACYPNDICEVMLSICKYEGREPGATAADLERATGLYFAKTR
ncbi:MAG: ATP-binding protein [Bryobacteraceae bacterium]